LHAGDLGATLGRILMQQGTRVVTPIADRSARTRRLAAAIGMEMVPTMADVAAIADVVLSVVPPSAAVVVARQFCAHANPGTLFVDVNSLAPATAREVADVCRGRDVECVDAAVHGMASRLPDSGTVYLSGPAAPAIAALFAPRLRTTIVGTTIGDASAFKM